MRSGPAAGHKLLDGLPGVSFHIYDKKSGLAGMRALRREFPDGRFEALLQMQVAARANLLSAEKLITGDKYIFIRNAYLQSREFKVKDGQVVDDF